MKSKLLRVLALFFVVALVAAACGNDDDDDTASGDGAAATAAPTAAATAAPTAAPTAAATADACVLGRGVSDDGIKLGSSLPLTGNLAALGEAAEFALEGHVDRINAAGGINGRMLSLVTQDDEFSPEQAVLNGQYFAEREQVFAVWGSIGTAPTVAAIEVHDDAEMLTLFPWALDQTLQDVEAHPLFFSHAPPAFNQTKAWSDYMVENFGDGDLRIGMMVINSADGEQTTRGFEAGTGAEFLADNQTWERDATTYGPQILSFIDNEVTDIYIGTGDTGMAQFIQEADQLGLDARFWGSSGTVTANAIELLGDLADEDVYGVTFVESSDADIPGIAAYRELVLGAGGDETHLGTASLLPYVSGLIVEEALKRAGECLNNETFVAAMESITDFDTGGIMPPLTFTPDNHLGNNAVIIFQVQDSAWIRIN
jgi:ABC-type branched-subunit amino acid transport system substrate-binding protein